MDANIYNTQIDTIKKIRQIEFGVYGNREVIRQSVFGRDTNGVEGEDLYDNSEAKKGSLNDTRMGTVSHDVMCATCGMKSECPGHFGHMTLAEPVFNYGFLPTIQKIMNCVCIRCSKLYIHKNEKEIKEILKTKQPKDRLMYIRNATKNVTHCQKVNSGCGNAKPKIKLDTNKKTGAITFNAEYDTKQTSGDNEHSTNEYAKKKISNILNAETIHEIFRKISKEDCMLLGIDASKNNIEELIITHLTVPPIQVRPPSYGNDNGGMNSEDDLTHKLVEIFRVSKKIMKNRESHDSDKTNDMGPKYVLQYQVATYMNNEGNALPKADSKGGMRPYKSIFGRIKGKKGRIRANLNGKRGDFTGRTVITSDPSLRNNQLGIPLQMAMNLTVPVVVTPDNIEHLTKLVRRGRNEYPGANFVHPVSTAKFGRAPRQINLRYGKENVKLNFGDIVERHLINDDIVLLNRQPTLHKHSMMAFKAVIVNDSDRMTFGMSVDVTHSFNADFDGDEMNIFIPQSLITMVELEEIACVERQIISPTTSKTANGTKQDGLVGSYLLTHPDTKLDWRSAMNLLAHTINTSNTSTTTCNYSGIKKNKDITGSELYSMIIPDGVNISGKINIRDGKIRDGRLTDAVLGSGGKNTLIQFIWEKYGVDITEEFVDNTRFLANSFNLLHGFSVGWGDLEKNNEVKNQIGLMFDTTRLKLQHLITEIENNPNLMSKDAFETSVYALLKKTNDEGNELVSNNLDEYNGFKVMQMAGSKGKASNLGQMMGCMGLQVFEGKLMPPKYNGRTLPYFHKSDDTANSRGLVQQSFYTGLDFVGMYFQTVNGRSGLIDAAVKTAQTGYLQHRLVKVLEDTMVKHDGTVRNQNNNVVQFIYGDSGANTISQHEYEINMLEMNNEKLESVHMFTADEMKKYGVSKDLNNKFIDELKTLRNTIIASVRKNKLNYIVKIKAFMIPLNLTRIVGEISNPTSGKSASTTDLTMQYVLDKIHILLSNEHTPMLYMSNNERKQNAEALNSTGDAKLSVKQRDEYINKTVLRAAIYDAISPKRVMVDYNMSKTAFDKLMTEISDGFIRNMVEPGEMVGVIAACGIGEPGTQLNLKSFHHAGVSRTNMLNMGFPRMNELLSSSKDQKQRAPEMRIYLNPDIRTKKDVVHRIKSHLKQTVFGEIYKKITCIYDPMPNFDAGITMQDRVYSVQFMNRGKHEKDPVTDKSAQSDILNSPFLIRVELDREKIAEKEIRMSDIGTQFRNWWDMRLSNLKNIRGEEKRIMNKITNMTILVTGDNSSDLIVHFRFNVRDYEKDKFDQNTIKNFITYVIDKFRLKGINGVDDIYPSQEDKILVFDPVTGETRSETEFMISTSGVNLQEIRYFHGIDLHKSLSNDIIKMYNTFGVESARSMLMYEIGTAFSMAGGGDSVNSQHIAVVADVMTMTGGINSIDRHGMGRSDINPLSRASFEKPVEELLTAAVHSEVDNMEAVSSKIMAGEVVKGGTGYSDFYFNNDVLENTEYEYSGYNDKYEKIKSERMIDDIVDNANDDVFVP